MLLPLAAAVGPTGWAGGGDLSPGMVGQCRRVLAEHGRGDVPVEVVDAQDPHWPEPSVTAGLDVVCSSLVLFFLPDPGAAVARWRELLRPGGRLGLSTFGSPDLAWLRVEEVFVPFLPPGLLDARTTGARGPFAFDAALEALLLDAGYVDTTTTHLALEVHFADAEQWYRFSMSVGQRSMWLAVPPDQRESVKAQALTLLSESGRPDGSLTFVQDVRYTTARRPGA